MRRLRRVLVALIAALIVAGAAPGIVSPAGAATRRPTKAHAAAKRAGRARANKQARRDAPPANESAPQSATVPTAAAANGSMRLSVYYTAVEAFHTGPDVAVTGCSQPDCRMGSTPLGSFPGDFVTAVKQEGTGRITSGATAGRYLNWSYDIGYWLDSIPADSYGRALIPFQTAAAEGFLPRGTQFVVTGCGSQGGVALESGACGVVQGTRWNVQDEFTPGLGGDGHLDLYIGEETGPRFTDTSPLWFDVLGASIQTVG